MQCSITDKLSKQDQMAPPCQGQQIDIKLSECEPKSAWAVEFTPFLCTIPRNEKQAVPNDTVETLLERALEQCSARHGVSLGERECHTSGSVRKSA